MLEKSYQVVNLFDKLEATGMKGKDIIYIDDWSAKQLMSLFEAASMIEPYSRVGTNLLEGKILYNIFFQPSTRTRCSHAAAMMRLGGSVITETDPLTKLAMAKGETLYDVIRVVSEYADVIVLRHGDGDAIFQAYKDLEGHHCPLISGGWGHETHPTQGMLDLYTAWRFLGKPFKDMKIMISTPDLSRARAAHSFAVGAVMMGAKVIYTGAGHLRTPDHIIKRLNSFGGNFEEHFDLTHAQNIELMETSADLLYLPGCVQKLDDPKRHEFMQNAKKHHIALADVQGIKDRTGKSVGVMHALSRQDFEMERALDNTEFQLYFRTIGFSVALRMALFSAILGNR